MKRIPLITLAVLALTSMGMAQDIWLGTSQTDSNGKSFYTLSKNGTVMQTHQNPTFSYEMTDLIAVGNGDVYYLNHIMPAGNDPMQQRTEVRVQSGDDNEVVYECPTGQGIHLKDLAFENGDIYACGSFLGNDGIRYAHITKSGEVFHQSEQDGYYSDMHGITVHEGDVFTCGGRSFTSGASDETSLYPQVWKNGSPLAVASEHNGVAYDIAIYGPEVFVCGKVFIGGLWKGALWITTYDIVRPLVLIDVVSDNESVCNKLSFDGGNIYVSYEVDGIESGVWKCNVGTYTPVKHFTYEASCASCGNIVANNHGIFTTADDEATYYLDGEAVATPVEAPIHKIAVHCPRQNTVYELPFVDQFENSFVATTHWDDWFSYDYDNHNSTNKSYWHRVDYSGNEEYAVMHGYNGETMQSGDLCSPAIRIPSDVYAKLGFAMQIGYLQYYNDGSSSVWIIEDDGTPLTDDNYTDFPKTKIWSVDEIVDTLFSDVWYQIEIDLSEYKGKTIRVVFNYEGKDAHKWFIDEVSVWRDSYEATQEHASDVMAIYPNPASESIRIESLQAESKVEICNVMGGLVKIVEAKPNKEIDISDLAEGVYMLRCGNATMKFVKAL